jgi:L-fuculose-phosphate aldolase
MNLAQLRGELAHSAKRIVEQRLVVGAGGNVSAREGDRILISPSGFALEDVAPEEFVEVNIATGMVAPRAQPPSSELQMHLACYRLRPDIAAVIHTHPRFAIALTSSGHDLRPMFPDLVIYAGANIPHLDYIAATTPEMAAAVASMIAKADCLILRNHGAITLGKNLRQAFWRACLLEESAHIQLLANLVGRPRFLDEQEVAHLDSLSSEQYRQQLVIRMGALPPINPKRGTRKK